MQRHAEVLLKEKKIAAIPDWSKALRPDFLERARTVYPRRIGREAVRCAFAERPPTGLSTADYGLRLTALPARERP